MSRERLPARAGIAETQASGIRAGGFFHVRLLGLAALILGSACSPGPRQVPEAPNVLLISVDTLRADHLGCYGAPAVETPAIDQLAAAGVRFENAFSPVPLTLPAHWTVLSGLQPWHHGVVDNGMALPTAPVATLAERFAAAGYDTAAFVAAFVLHRSFGLNRGFATYDDGPAADAALDQSFHATAPADERVGRALDWLRRERQQPFFLWLHLFDPHAPYEPPPAFRALYAGRPYDGEIAFVDTQVARILAGLARAGLTNRPLVVLLSDHGESLGEHGEQTHGVLLYDSTLRVPLIFRLPGSLPPGTVRRDPATLADVAPTVLALAGLETGPRGDGTDLFAPRSGTAERELAAISESPRRRLGWAGLTAIRDGPWKYILAPQPELYRVADDPGELTNLVSTEPADAASLASAARRVANELRDLLVQGRATDPGAEERARLAALGYLAGEAATTARESEGGTAPNPRDEIGTLAELDRAYQMLAEGRLEEADPAFRALVAHDPPPLAALEGLGRVARLRGQQADAERLFERILVRDPQSLTALAQLVTLAGERGDFRLAAARAQQLAALVPNDAGASRLLAEALLAAERSAEAEAEWRRGLALSPRAGWLRLGLARYLATAHRQHEAVQELDRILTDEEMSPELVSAAQTARAALPPRD